MKALRITQKPQNGMIIIQLPEEFRKHKLIEVIILPFEEATTSRKKINVKKLKGAVDLKMTVDEIAGESEKMRDEWQRNI